MKQSLAKRIEMLETEWKPQKTLTDPEHVQEYQKCKEDVAYFVDTYCWTYDPRQEPAFLRFRLFPKQKEFLYWLQQRLERKEHGIVEKCRDIGMSWLCCCFLVHKFIFHPGFKGTIGSRKESLVDRLDDPDSLFSKIRMALERLPDWMKPDYRDSYLKLINYSNGATITGEAGDNMGRGGRSTIYFIDEAAFIERPNKVEAALSANSDVRIKVSTPNGMGNVFADQRFSENYPVFTFHWQDDPRKTQEWYEKQKLELDPVVFAQEVEIDYNASAENVLILHKWVLAAIQIELEPEGPLIAGLDVADGGSNLNVYIVRQGSVVSDILSWSGENTTQTGYRAIAESRERGVSHINLDVVGIGTGVGATLKENPVEGLSFTALRGGDTPTNKYWANGKSSEDLFRNRRAEMAWMLRERFRKTYDHVSGIRESEPGEMISIPEHSELIKQLGKPQFRFADSGKIQLESKDDMKKRGVKSPDFFDALCYCFADRPTWSFHQSRAYWDYSAY